MQLFKGNILSKTQTKDGIHLKTLLKEKNSLDRVPNPSFDLNDDIIKRIQFDKNVWIVDPDGCQDADDAFSVFMEEGQLKVAIHIADPTKMVGFKSQLWENISRQSETIYFVDEAKHLLPDDLVKHVTLNEPGNRFAITIIIDINDDGSINYQPSTKGNLGNIDLSKFKIQFSILNVNKDLIKSYRELGEDVEKDTEFNKIYSEIEAIFIDCKKLILDGKVTEYEKSLITLRKIVSDNITKYKTHIDNPMVNIFISILVSKVYFAINFQFKKIDKYDTLESETHLEIKEEYIDHMTGEYKPVNKYEKVMKKTIEAFALLCNNCVGVYLSNAVESKFPKFVYRGMEYTGAKYSSTAIDHDKVGLKDYCHFTSPMRRVVDFYNHYLLKLIFQIQSLKIDNSILQNYFNFSNTELDSIIENTNHLRGRYKDVGSSNNNYKILKFYLKYKDNIKLITFIDDFKIYIHLNLILDHRQITFKLFDLKLTKLEHKVKNITTLCKSYPREMHEKINIEFNKLNPANIQFIFGRDVFSLGSFDYEPKFSDIILDIFKTSVEQIKISKGLTLVASASIFSPKFTTGNTGGGAAGTEAEVLNPQGMMAVPQQSMMIPGLMPMQHGSTPFYPGLMQPGSLSQGAYMSPAYIQDNGFIPGGVAPGLMPMQHGSTPFYPGLMQPGSVSQGAYMSPSYIQDNGFIPGGVAPGLGSKKKLFKKKSSKKKSSKKKSSKKKSIKKKSSKKKSSKKKSVNKKSSKKKSVNKKSSKRKSSKMKSSKRKSN